MQKRFALIIILALALAPLLATAGEHEHGKMDHSKMKCCDEHMADMIKSSTTPESNAALAADYRAAAEAARKEAAAHRSMASAYLGTKALYHQQMAKHCERIVKLQEEMAAEYDALAKEHEARTKK